MYKRQIFLNIYFFIIHIFGRRATPYFTVVIHHCELGETDYCIRVEVFHYYGAELSVLWIKALISVN